MPSADRPSLNLSLRRSFGLSVSLILTLILIGILPPGMRGLAAGKRDPAWGFRPVIPREVPSVRNRTWCLNDVDRFILSNLETNKLSPSTQASSRELVRRLYFDLTGLPPSPREVESFVSDSSPGAYEHLVDRLLASPRYGERWARHWLDVAHFGETHGYDKDKLRPNAWPYRDYVIRSFNQDKPFPRFLQEQLAGDVLFPDNPDGVVALGFVAAGPWDYVGHVELPESKTDGLIARYNDRDDMVTTTISTFLSVTVHCARCHDHKFDPINSSDYYALQAVFAGVDRAERPYDPDPQLHLRRQALLKERSRGARRLDEIHAMMGRLTPPGADGFEKEKSEAKKALNELPNAGSESPSNGYHSGIESDPSSVKWVQIDLGGEGPIDSIKLIPARPTDFTDTPGFGFPSRYRVEMGTDAEFRTSVVVIADLTAEDVANPGDKPVEFQAGGRSARYIRVTATKLWERTKDYVFALAEVEVMRQTNNVAAGAVVSALDSIEAGRWGKARLVDGYDSRKAVRETPGMVALRAKREALEATLRDVEKRRAAAVDAMLDPAVLQERQMLERRATELQVAVDGLPKPHMVYAAAPDFSGEGNFKPARGVRDVQVLTRGDVKRPRGEAVPKGLACIPGVPPDLDSGTDEGARRASLAKWLSDPRNLHTRRSYVNRIWQYHFGRGLSDTPNDFGAMGSAPTHPELLDWLTLWFVEHGESTKALHRLLVTSAAYRQSSANREGCAVADGDNRYLWRMNRTRLDAESVHDAMLAVSGSLDLRMGGPGDRQFFFKDDHSPVYDYARFDPAGEGANRRSVYRHLVRSVPDPFFECLDGADPSQLVARRNTTLTALQALTTLNDPFVLKQCEALARRASGLEKGLAGQVRAAWTLALGREPSTAEESALVGYARRFGLVNACRVVLNHSEFLFID